MFFLIANGKLLSIFFSPSKFYDSISNLCECTVFATRTAAATTPPPTTSSVAKLITTVELTAKHHLSKGTNYPPIEQDVTFWCVKP